MGNQWGWHGERSIKPGATRWREFVNARKTRGRLRNRLSPYRTRNSSPLISRFSSYLLLFNVYRGRRLVAVGKRVAAKLLKIARRLSGVFLIVGHEIFATSFPRAVAARISAQFSATLSSGKTFIRGGNFSTESKSFVPSSISRSEEFVNTCAVLSREAIS